MRLRFHHVMHGHGERERTHQRRRRRRMHARNGFVLAQWLGMVVVRCNNSRTSRLDLDVSTWATWGQTSDQGADEQGGLATGGGGVSCWLGRCSEEEKDMGRQQLESQNDASFHLYQAIHGFVDRSSGTLTIKNGLHAFCARHERRT